MKIKQTTILELDTPVKVVRVPSFSTKGKSYAVVLSCECPSFRFNGWCKHASMAGSVLRLESQMLKDKRNERQESWQEDL
jgi:hypothetical protein